MPEPEHTHLSKLTTGRRITLYVIAVLSVAFVAFHFGMTALHHMPFNPIREKHDDKIRAYMTPYFQQDWHLFAPDPVAEDSGFLVRVKRVTPNGSLETTQWADVTTPHIDKLQGQRFWPSRVERLAPAVRQRIEGWRDPELDELRHKNQLKSQKKDPDPPLAPGELAGRDSALLYARGVASSEAKALWGDDIHSVQIRIVVNQFPRFSERTERDNKGKVTYYDLAWMKPLKVSR
ncbi:MULTISPECIES: DUF5819 family protein [Streptomyces]|uniref:DUF5819 family protein n=1 Tax=Streptomyces pratisoli TaxID=3139917 RepID=A0ACC6QB13_9ACTN|nr:DUF5819 family protein [Streptomyces sp. NBC_00259]